jgi:hypothetical protein
MKLSLRLLYVVFYIGFWIVTIRYAIAYNFPAAIFFFLCGRQMLDFMKEESDVR